MPARWPINLELEVAIPPGLPKRFLAIPLRLNVFSLAMMKAVRSWRHAGGILVLALGLAAGARVAFAAPAELVVRQANVITMDPNRPRGQAFAVANGKFVTVGSDDSMEAFIGANTRVLDLAGKTVVPG